MTAQSSAATAKAVSASDFVRPARVLSKSASIVACGKRMGFHPVADVARFHAWVIA